MEKTTLISVRMPDNLLKRIDSLVEGRSYRNRSYVMRRVLEHVLTCADEDNVFRLIDMEHAYDKGYVCTFERDLHALTERMQKDDDEDY